MTTPPIDRARVAAMIDHTVLRPETTVAEVADLCAEANELRVAAICISPSLLPVPAGALDDAIAVAAVCGFPSGAHTPDVKAAEAARAVADGATEIDMVIDLGAATAGDWDRVARGIEAVRAVTGGAVLKVIVESGALDDDALVKACEVSEAAGADFVKTSTGFHPTGGATVHAVALMAATVGGRLGVKASGGIRTADDAIAMIEAGATRIGASKTREILAGLE
ncbi:MAG TPA: deoxyribose-phosphate aldolase [Acidimicrobiales bacterium]|nr:deoxyribose-phosphate aldolase [Acidimicrobiales bacterium]